MAKYANAGELRTNLFFKKVVRGTDDEGYNTEIEKDLFTKADGTAIPIKGKWVNVHGSEVFEAMTLELKDPATITTRYSPKLEDITLTMYKEHDPEPFEVISADNVENRNIWLEIKVSRKRAAK